MRSCRWEVAILAWLALCLVTGGLNAWDYVHSPSISRALAVLGRGGVDGAAVRGGG